MQNVTIDDKTVTVREGTTILEAATKAGIWIPTLCYNQSMTPAAACRLCMVELVQGDRTKLVTSCNYPVRKDLTVKVSSDRAVKARKGIMELLLARSPESLELKELAGRMGVHGTPLSDSDRKPAELHPLRPLCGSVRRSDGVFGHRIRGAGGRKNGNHPLQACD